MQVEISCYGDRQSLLPSTCGACPSIKHLIFEFSIFLNSTIFLLMVMILELYVIADPPPLTFYN